MTREALNYGDGGRYDGAEGFDPDVPVEGWYRHKLVTGGHPVAVRIWFGPPLEPWTNEEMDRAPRWNAQINGEWSDVERVWPRCALYPIDEAEGRYLIRVYEWGKKHAPNSPQANPRQKINLLTAPIDL